MGENSDFLSLSEALCYMYFTSGNDCFTVAGDICTQNETTTVWKQSM